MRPRLGRLRRWGILLALAGLPLPWVQAAVGAEPPPRGGGHVSAPDAGSAPDASAETAGVRPDPLPLGDPWEAVVVEPAPPGGPAPRDAALPEATGAAPGVPPPSPAPGPEESARSLPAAVAPDRSGIAVPRAREHLRPVLVRYARQNRLPPDLVMALAWKESSWRANAVSKAGAVGVMQLMPATVEFTSLRLLGLDRRLDPRDPVANIRMGTRYLRHLVDRAGGNYRRALMAYHQGPTSLRTRGPFPSSERFADTVLALRGEFRPA